MSSSVRNRLSRVDHLEVKNKVNFYLSVQRYDAAEKLLKSTLVRHKENAGLFNLLGVTYHKQSRFPDAIKQFKAALVANPFFLEASLNLISTLCDLSRYDEAKAIYDNLGATMNQQFKIPQLIVGRLANQHAENGRIYAQAGIVSDAIKEFNKALALFPNLPDVRLTLARLYFDDGSYEKARAELEQLVSTDPESISAKNLLGLVYHKVGRADLAKSCWQQSMQSDPDDLTSRVLNRAAQAWANP